VNDKVAFTYMPIYLVVPKGTVVFKAYTRVSLADRHAGGETGVEVIEIDVEDKLSDEIMDNLSEYDEDELTPVVARVEPTGEAIEDE
jgi:hypothetical protein